jgi:hypothetical protein
MGNKCICSSNSKLLFGIFNTFRWIRIGGLHNLVLMFAILRTSRDLRIFDVQSILLDHLFLGASAQDCPPTSKKQQKQRFHSKFISQSNRNFNWGVVCIKMRSTHIRENKYSQLIMGILVQVENTDKPFWKLNFRAAMRTL